MHVCTQLQWQHLIGLLDTETPLVPSLPAHTKHPPAASVHVVCPL